MSSPAQIAANRSNSKLSSGPRTPEGKAISSVNNLKLGLACRTFAVLANEDQAEFDKYTRDLAVEYGVKTLMERTLVNKIAQHHWLGQRAFVAEQLCLGQYGIPETEEQERQLALMLRYQAHHDRAFHKTRNELEKLIAARTKRNSSTVSKPVAQPQAKPQVFTATAAQLQQQTPPQPATAQPVIAPVPINEAA